jgi:hypothetical protein
MKSGSLNLLESPGTVQVYTGIVLPLLYTLFQQQCKNFMAMLLLNEITGTLCMAGKNQMSPTYFMVIPWYLTKWLQKRLTR